MIILMIAMLVMPILHQPQKAEAEIFTFAILTLIIAGATAYIMWEIDQPNPCPAGCNGMVDNTDDHVKSCGNCGQLVHTCIETYPDLDEGIKFDHHKADCPKGCGPNGVVPGCTTLYYTCDHGTKLPSEQPRYRHRILESDCGIHHHRACLPSNNHRLNTGDCGIHSYPECSPELNHLPADTLCAHKVYTCTVGHEDVFCDLCSFYPACEDHVCPSDDSSGCCDDSSGCCDDSSGCCDDGS